MVKVLVSCANGAGTSLMMKMRVEKVFNDLNIKTDIHHCALSEGKSSASNYSICFCPLNFVEMFKDAAEKGTTIVGVKNVISEAEIKEKLLASGFLDTLKN